MRPHHLNDPVDGEVGGLAGIVEGHFRRTDIDKNMPAKKTKLAAGARIRLKPVVKIPEVPEVDAQGWSGRIVESKGRGASLQYIIEWDEETEANMPKEFVEACEQASLFYKMACLPHTDVEAID